MKVRQLLLNQFTAFNKAEFDFCPGINVFIGANSTGKSHVMKVIYASLKACEIAHRAQVNLKRKVESLLEDKLKGVFKPNTLDRLVRYGINSGGASVDLTYGDRKFDFTLYPRGHQHLVSGHPVHLASDSNQLPKPVSSLYLPAQEFLSIYEGFIAAYQKRETAFDETYYDLSIALNASPLRDPKLPKELVSSLEKAINGGQVIQADGLFYVKWPRLALNAHLVSEGYRKLASLIYLINNGSLTPDCILFWDEPAANLNPKLVSVVVEVLCSLATTGVQVFLATHDYLLSQKLSLSAEYPSDTLIKFFALHQPDQGGGIVVECGETLTDIENNPILDEFAAHYDKEVELFQQTQGKDE